MMNTNVLLNHIVSDIQHALRGLKSGGGTTALAVTILTLSMTAATITLSIVDAIVLRPLPYTAPERLVDVTQLGPNAAKIPPVSPQQYYVWLESRAFESHDNDEGLGGQRLPEEDASREGARLSSNKGGGTSEEGDGSGIFESGLRRIPRAAGTCT